jgi:hypothetical protein
MPEDSSWSSALLRKCGISGWSSPGNSERWEARMHTLKYVHWQEGDGFLGYLVDYPDYWTQGESPDDLKDHLVDLFRDITSGELPGIRRVDDLKIP